MFYLQLIYNTAVLLVPQDQIVYSDTSELFQWVPEITHHCQKTPFLLVGTQVDLRDDVGTLEKLQKNRQKPVSIEIGEKLARDLRAVKYVECSALTQVLFVNFNAFMIC